MEKENLPMSATIFEPRYEGDVPRDYCLPWEQRFPRFTDFFDALTYCREVINDWGWSDATFHIVNSEGRYYAYQAVKSLLPEEELVNVAGSFRVDGTLNTSDPEEARHKYDELAARLLRDVDFDGLKPVLLPAHLTFEHEASGLGVGMQMSTMIHVRAYARPKGKA